MHSKSLHMAILITMVFSYFTYRKNSKIPTDFSGEWNYGKFFSSELPSELHSKESTRKTLNVQKPRTSTEHVHTKGCRCVHTHFLYNPGSSTTWLRYFYY